MAALRASWAVAFSAISRRAAARARRRMWPMAVWDPLERRLTQVAQVAPGQPASAMGRRIVAVGDVRRRRVGNCFRRSLFSASFPSSAEGSGLMPHYHSSLAPCPS